MCTPSHSIFPAHLSYHLNIPGGNYPDTGGILKRAWLHKEPFALYLRSFSLGARLGKPEFDSQGFAIAHTSDPMEDERFQAGVVEHLAPQLPVVGIENPTLELRHDKAMPRLSLSGETWQDAVRVLVPAASTILVYVGANTEGIRWELDVIRSAGREHSTALFASTSTIDVDTSGFSEVVVTSGLLSENEAEKVRHCIVPSTSLQHFDFDWPDPPAPPKAIRGHTDALANIGLMAGRGFLDSGDYAAAVDALSASIACAFWAQNDHARAFAHKYLGIAYLRQSNVQYAFDSLELALSLFERFSAGAPSSVAEAIQDLDEFEDVFDRFTPTLQR